MRSRNKWLCIGIFLLLYGIMLKKATAQTGTMDLKKAIEVALANNRSLRADSLNIPITGLRFKELAGQYLPQVNYTSSTEYNPAIATQMLPGSLAGQPSKDYVPVQFGTRYNMRSGIEVTQTIYRKDLQLQLKEAGLQINIAKTRYTLSREGLVYQVASLFYALQANATLIRTTRFDYQNMKEVLDIAQAQFENGVLKKIDYESLKINVANMLSQLNQLQTQYDDQLAHFNYLLGLPAEHATIISDEGDDHLPEWAISGIGQKRNDILLAGQLIQSKEREMLRIRAEKKPVISSFARFNMQSQFNKPENAFDNDYLNKASTVGITVSMSIFDGHRRKYRMHTAITQLDQLKFEYSRKQEEASMELLSATRIFNNNQDEWEITKENLQLATNVFSSRKALYTEGVSSLTELLDAERELSKARNNHIQALINVQSGWVDLHKANGTLLTDFLQSK